MTETEDLRQQLVGALKSRAMLLAALYDELVAEIGETKALALMKRATHARGVAAGRRFFAAHAPDDFAGLRTRFVDFLPDHGGLFELRTLRCDTDGLTLAFDTCPLKAAWIEAGVPAQRMQALCEISGAVDVGTFEGAGFAIDNHTWQPGRDGCCTLEIRRAGPPAGTGDA